MKLDCILDSCPKNNRPVDMRKCCGVHGVLMCQFYGMTPWAEMGEVTCTHPEANTSNEKLKKERMEAFQITASSVGYILYIR